MTPFNATVESDLNIGTIFTEPAAHGLVTLIGFVRAVNSGGGTEIVTYRSATLFGTEKREFMRLVAMLKQANTRDRPGRVTRTRPELVLVWAC